MTEKALYELDLAFNNRAGLSIEDEDRFASFSSFMRTGTGLAARSNTIETTHGQLNNRTSKGDEFWRTLTPTAIAMQLKSPVFYLGLPYNDHRAVRQKRRYPKRTDDVRMRAHYGTTSGGCRCGNVPCFRHAPNQGDMSPPMSPWIHNPQIFPGPL
jgi:hypothetical protein